MKKHLKVFAAVGVLCAAPVLAACGSDDDEPSSGGGGASGEPIKVMTMGPIDAPGFSIPEIQTAAEAAVAKVNDAGGVNGRPLELVVCNDKNDPNTASGCARQAQQEGVVAVLGGVTTQEAQATPAFEQTKIPMVGFTPITDFTSPVYFPFSGGGASSYFGLAKSMIDNPVCNGKAGAVIEEFAATQGAMGLFELGVKASGGEYTGVTSAPQGSADFAPAAAAAAESANCLGFASGPQAAPQLVAAIEGTGKVDLYGASDTISLPALGALGEKAPGLVTVTDFLPGTSDEPTVKDVVKRGTAIDPDFAFNQLSAATFAAVELFAKTMEGVDEITPETVTEEISKVAEYDTGLGPIVDFTVKNPSKAFARLPVTSPMFTQVNEGGKFVNDGQPLDISAIYEAAAAAGQ